MNLIAPSIWERLYHSGRVFLTYLLIYQQIFLGVVSARGNILEDTDYIIQFVPLEVFRKDKGDEERYHDALKPESLKTSQTGEDVHSPSYKFSIHRRRPSASSLSHKAAVSVDKPEEGSLESLFESQVFPSLGVWNNTEQEINLSSGFRWEEKVRSWVYEALGIHLVFQMDQKGGLHFTEFQAVGKKIGIQSAHEVYLQGTVESQELKVSAPIIYTQRAQMKIETFEVWAQGLKEDQEKVLGSASSVLAPYLSGGFFIHEPSSHLQVQTLKLHEGTFVNRGRLDVGANGAVDLKGHTLLNEGAIVGQESFNLTSARFIQNKEKGEILALHTLTLASDVLENKGRLRGEQETLLYVTEGANHHEIESRYLRLMIGKQWTHQEGVIKASRSLSLEGEGTFKGHAPLYGYEIAIGLKGFEHHGEMKSSTFVHFKDTIQHWQTGEKAKIEASMISLMTQDHKARHQGLLKANHYLALSQEKFTNQGKIEASTLSLKGEEFTNEGRLEGKNFTLSDGKHFHNKKGASLEVHDQTLLKGEAFLNEGILKLDGLLQVDLKEFKNTGVMTVEGLLKGVIKELTNQGAFTVDHLSLEGEIIRTQAGTFTVKDASTYTGDCWYNDGKVDAARMTLKALAGPQKWMDFRNRRTFNAQALIFGPRGGLFNAKGSLLKVMSTFTAPELTQFMNEGEIEIGQAGWFGFDRSDEAGLRFGKITSAEEITFKTHQPWQWAWLKDVKAGQISLDLGQDLRIEDPVSLEKTKLNLMAPSLAIMSELKVGGLHLHLKEALTIGEAILTPFPSPKKPSDAVSFYDVKRGQPYLEVTGRRGILESYGPVQGKVGSFILNNGSFYTQGPVYIQSHQEIMIGQAREGYKYYSRHGQYLAYPYFQGNGTTFTCDSDCRLESLNNHILVNLASLIIKGDFYGLTPSGYPLTNWAGTLLIFKNAYFKGYGFDHLTSERNKSPYVRDRYPDGIDYSAYYRQGGGAPYGSMACVLQGPTTNDTLIADAPKMTVMGDTYWLCDYVHNQGGEIGVHGGIHLLPGTRYLDQRLPHSLGLREAILSSPYQIIIEESPHVKHEGTLASPFIMIKGQRVETPVTHELGEAKPFVSFMGGESIVHNFVRRGVLVPQAQGEAYDFPYAKPSQGSLPYQTIMVSSSASEAEKIFLRSLSMIVSPEVLPFIVDGMMLELMCRNYVTPRENAIEATYHLMKNAYGLSEGTGFLDLKQIETSPEALLSFKPGYYQTSYRSGYWLVPYLHVPENPQLLALRQPGPKMVGEEVILKGKTALLQGGIYAEKRVQLLVDYLTCQKPTVAVEVVCATTTSQGGLFGDKNKTTYRTEIEHRLQDTGWIKVGAKGGVYVQGKQAHLKGIEVEVGEEGLHVHVSESFEAGPARGAYYVPYEASAEGVGSSYSEKGFALQEILAPFKLKMTGQNNEIVSKEVATLQATQIEGKGSQETMLLLKAPTVDLPSDKVIKTYVAVKQKGSVFEKTITHQEVAHHNLLKDLTVHVEAEQVEGVHPTLNQAVLNLQASLIKLISQDAFAATLKTIVHKQVVGSSIDPGLAMVVGLAAGLATCGWGSALMNALAESMFGMVSVASATGAATMVPAVTLSSLGVAMADAGLSAICSQAASSLMSTGSLKEMSQELTSSQFAKSLTITLTSAGLMNKLSSTLNLPSQPKGFEQHVKVSAVRSTVSAGLNMTIGGMKPEDALVSAARMIVAGTLGGLGANEIAQIYRDGQLDYLIHKLTHALLGAGMGSILSEDAVRGAVSGAVGGFFGEIAGEELVDRLGNKQLTTILGQMDETVMKAQLAAAIATVLMGQDAGVATFVAENAIRNNSYLAALIQAAKAVVQVGSKKGAKHIAKKGAEQAARTVAKEGVKTASKALKKAPKGVDTSSFTKETKELVGKNHKFKEQLLARKGESKADTTLRAAQKEMKGQQIEKALERGIQYNHVEKAESAQRGLTRHIQRINNRLSYPELPQIERQALQKELSQSSRLLDYAKQFLKDNS